MKVDLLIIPINNLLVGIYKDKKLIKIIKKDGKCSEKLPIVFEEIYKKYEIRNVIYTNSPGTFMAIKITYIFIKTLEISLGINIYACDAFNFNKNSPIKAMNNLYFIKENESIKTVSFKNIVMNDFNLPNSIENIKLNNNINPTYNMPYI